MRQSSRSVDEHVRLVRQGAAGVTWPAAIDKMPRPADQARAEAIFEATAACRAYDDWRPSDWLLLAQFSVATTMLETLVAKIDSEGWTIEKEGRNGNLHSVKNPALDGLTHCTSRQLQLYRALGLTGAVADRRVVANAARRQGAGMSAAFSGGHDSLLAQPDGGAIDWVKALADQEKGAAQ